MGGGHPAGRRPCPPWPAAGQPWRLVRAPAAAAAAAAALVLVLVMVVAAAAGGTDVAAAATTAAAAAAGTTARQAAATAAGAARRGYYAGRGYDRCIPTNVRVRKEARTLTASERWAYTTTVRELVRSGGYADFVRLHEAHRVAAHGGARFLPWHRLFVLEFEEALRVIHPNVTVPYCTWGLPWEGLGGAAAAAVCRWS